MPTRLPLACLGGPCWSKNTLGCTLVSYVGGPWPRPLTEKRGLPMPTSPYANISQKAPWQVSSPHLLARSLSLPSMAEATEVRSGAVRPWPGWVLPLNLPIYKVGVGGRAGTRRHLKERPLIPGCSPKPVPPLPPPMGQPEGRSWPLSLVTRGLLPVPPARRHPTRLPLSLRCGS